jgi:site-specific recombinase XerD
MLRRGAGLRQLQVLLGHSSSQTTETCTRVEIADLRRVVERRPPREHGHRARAGRRCSPPRVIPRLDTRHLEQLARYCTELWREPGVRHEDLMAYRQELAARVTPDTVLRILVSLRLFFRWACRRGHVLLDPSRDLGLLAARATNGPMSSARARRTWPHASSPTAWPR